MRILAGIVALGLLGVLGWAIRERLLDGGEASSSAGARAAVPVEIAPVEHGPIEDARTFSGTLEAPAEFVVAPKVGGRIVRLAVDLADEVERGDVLAELDDEEATQLVAQAEADLAVAKARATEAESRLEIAARALERVRALRKKEYSSESELDAAVADHLAAEASAEVAKAAASRAEASLATARIRRGYTIVAADWEEGDDTRFVAERLVDEGDTVAANTPLMSIVELDPLQAVISVTERDYGRLRVGQPATLNTDAWVGETFLGEIARIAPVFRRASRQARVELTVDNSDLRLKPGMFVRARVVLDRAEDATIVPVAALASRGGRDVVFVLDDAGGASSGGANSGGANSGGASSGGASLGGRATGTATATGNDGSTTVSMRPVEVRIRAGERAQVVGEGIHGHVVVLGQQLLEDGKRVTIPPTERETRGFAPEAELDPAAGRADDAGRAAGSGGAAGAADESAFGAQSASGPVLAGTPRGGAPRE